MSDETTTTTEETSLTDQIEAAVTELLEDLSEDLSSLATEALDDLVAQLKTELTSEIAKTSSTTVKVRDRLWLILLNNLYPLLKTIFSGVISTYTAKLVAKIVAKL